MADTTRRRRCGLCDRPLRPHEKGLCSPCEGDLMYEDEANPWTDDMQEDVNRMNAEARTAANKDEAR